MPSLRGANAVSGGNALLTRKGAESNASLFSGWFLKGGGRKIKKKTW